MDHFHSPLRGTGRTTRALLWCLNKAINKKKDVYYCVHNYGHVRHIKKMIMDMVNVMGTPNCSNQDTMRFEFGGSISVITQEESTSARFTHGRFGHIVKWDHHIGH